MFLLGTEQTINFNLFLINLLRDELFHMSINRGLLKLIRVYLLPQNRQQIKNFHFLLI